MRKPLAALLALLFVAFPAHAEQSRRPCLADIRRVCPNVGLNSTAIRACLAEHADQLSDACRATIRERMQKRSDQNPLATPDSTLRYGEDSLQTLDYYKGATDGARPLVIFIHGGGWAIGDKRSGTGAKAAFFTGHGYRYASINYRLVPKVDVATQAADVAAAIARLRADASALGIDPGRIALIGHSAGAHLAALVATDTRYLEKAGVPLGSVRAISLLDGAAYDVPRQVAAQGDRASALYVKAFGADSATQQALSPIAYTSAPNAGAFILHAVAQRPTATTQAEALASALHDAGTPAEMHRVEGSNHRDINQNIGAADDPVSQEILAFFERTL